MTLLSVDGTNAMHRAHHAVRYMEHKGTPTNAIIGFFAILNSNLRIIGAKKCLVTFDRTGGQNFRQILHPEYKGTREKDPVKSAALAKQVPIICDLLEAMGIAYVGKKDIEADDIIGSTAVNYEDGIAYILSGDKDFAQNLIHKHVRLINPNKKITVSRKNCKEVYGVDPKHMIDYLMLDGDDVDNIEGIPGIGHKTAIKLLEEFGKAERIPIERFPKGAQKTVNIPQRLKLNRKLVTIRSDLYDANTELDLSISKMDVKEFTKICNRYRLNSLLKTIK